MKTFAIIGLASFGLIVGVGCGPNCQNSCEQVFSQCNIQKAGRTQDELFDSCFSECNSALKISGPIGAYNPETRRSSNLPIDLENDQQAAAWMDCVWNHAPDASPDQCADLDPSSGFCAPI